MNNTDLKSMNKMIKGDIYQALRMALTAPDENTKHSFMDEFIPSLLKEATKNPSGVIGQMLAKQLMQDDIISSLDAQTEKLLAKDIDFLEYRVFKQLFKEQREVLLDNLVKRKCVMCSRRAGKTELNVRLLVKACAIPNSPCLYVNLTFANAINQTFDKIIDCAKSIELPIQQSSKADGFIIFSNGSSITFKGNTNKAEADKTRTKNTYFEKAWNTKEWHNYHWTMFENPYIPDPEEQLEKICNEKGLTRDSDFIRREYFGEIAYDTEAQVFKGYQTYESIPETFTPTDIVIGVDFGFSDYNGIASLAFNKDTSECYVILENKFNKSTSTAVVQCVRNQYENAKKFMIERAKLNNKDADLANITIVTDSNEKTICYELSVTEKLPAYPCYKYDKVMAISQLSDWCRTGKIKVPKDGYLAEEFDLTVYKRDDNDNITSEIDESYHPDIADALLYASRQMWFTVGATGGGISQDQKDNWQSA